MFKQRSHVKELIDADEIPEADLEINLAELHTVNQLLGGYNISINALKQLDMDGQTIVDIGCGGGNMALEISNWCEKKKINAEVWGLDIKPYCINRSNRISKNAAVQFVISDYKRVFEVIPNVNILHACLFTHHLGEAEIVDLIRLSIANKATLVINDLERNPLAYFSIKIITRLFSKSYLVKNDAPLSVLRGFKKHEWANMITKAGVKSYQIRWKWAFRHQIIIHG